MGGEIHLDPLIEAYFSHLVAELGKAEDLQIVCVAHMVSNSLYFVPALHQYGEVRLLLPKPKSVNREEHGLLTSLFPSHPLSRQWSSSAPSVISTLDRFLDEGRPFCIIDIGGYFASVCNALKEHFGKRFLGIMEGTENGLQKYELAGVEGLPVVSVARSPLKLPEDYLVGASIVFSVEAVLREHAQILQTRTACVIGYGRVGSSIASALRAHGINTVIFDSDPTKLAESSARGYQTFRTVERALEISTLVICATGNTGLDAVGFAALRSGTVVATVTSADDELDLEALANEYFKTGQGSLVRYESASTRKHFFLVNDGGPANFLHGAVIGPAIQLIEGEKLAALTMLKAMCCLDGCENEVSDELRARVASVWNEHFLD